MFLVRLARRTASRSFDLRIPRNSRRWRFRALPRSSPQQIAHDRLHQGRRPPGASNSSAKATRRGRCTRIVPTGRQCIRQGFANGRYLREQLRRQRRECRVVKVRHVFRQFSRPGLWNLLSQALTMARIASPAEPRPGSQLPIGVPASSLAALAPPASSLLGVSAFRCAAARTVPSCAAICFPLSASFACRDFASRCAASA
jgi:hypothetical protein